MTADKKDDSFVSLELDEDVPAAAPVAVANGGVCGSYGYIDLNNDGFISGDEWNTFHTRTYGDWDINHDGRVSQSEFENCYRAGGFYRTSYYNPDYWNYYWRGFDANGDGYLSADEYWAPSSWSTGSAPTACRSRVCSTSRRTSTRPRSIR